MIERIIKFSVRNRIPVLLAFAMLIGWGIWAVRTTPVDAIPDLSDNQVNVFTDYAGCSPQVVEDQVTYPLASVLQGIPRVKAVRAASSFGFSMIYVIFDDSADIYWARNRVTEKLTNASSFLPPGVAPRIGPEGTGVGHVFWYTLRARGYTLEQLRTLQDWFIRYQLSTVPGVAEVASIGGFVREYHVDLDQYRLASYRVTTADVIRALKRANASSGGKVVEQARAELIVQGLGSFGSLQEIENTPILRDQRGVPVLVKHLGTVQMGGAFRRGLLDLNGEGEVVGGIVVMQYNENAAEVISRIKDKIAAIDRGLPQGVEIATAYDRSELILRAVATLKRILTEETVAVTLIALLFLLHLPSALVIVLIVPVAVLSAFIAMRAFGITSNIMSLGGIAIAVGVLVDAGVIMVENTYRKLSELPAELRHDRRLAIIIESSSQVGRAIFFSMAVIILSFIPVFFLEGQEGKLFHPLAFTKTFTMTAAALSSITLVPVLMFYLLRGSMAPESRNPVSAFFIRLYDPLINWSLQRPRTVIAMNCAALLLAIPLFFSLGSEFMPPLDEGSILYMPTTMPNVSLTEAKRLIQVQDSIIKSTPEVDSVLGKVGRAETATDPAPVSMFETIILLKPKDQWRRGITKNDIVAELDGKLRQTGVRNGWTQPIINRINMLSTGIRTDLGVKIYGSDLNVLRDLAVRAETALKRIPGAADVVAERVLGGNYLDITFDRQAAARYGVSAQDVQDVIETAIGGAAVSEVMGMGGGRGRFAIRVRYVRDQRDTLQAVQRVLVPAADGTHVPLSLVARIATSSGPAEINSEGGMLRSLVFLNVRDRDMGSFVADAQKVLQQELRLPPGYSIAWAGQWENQVRAQARLRIMIPVGLAIIFALLYFTFSSAREAGMVMLSVPFALVGGVFFVFGLGYHLSVAVWVGFIALFGIAVETGVVMVLYLHEALDRKLQYGPITAQDIVDAAREGAVLRLRPKLMTVAVALIGLAPLMWSSGAGADVMRPIAAPMIGGMITSAVHVLIMTPVIFVLMKQRDLRKGKLSSSGFAADRPE